MKKTLFVTLFFSIAAGNTFAMEQQNPAEKLEQRSQSSDTIANRPKSDSLSPKTRIDFLKKNHIPTQANKNRRHSTPDLRGKDYFKN